jgi:hypothetical protein
MPFVEARGFSGLSWSYAQPRMPEFHVLLPPSPEPEPLTPERILALVQAAWPEDSVRAARILMCESKAGAHEDTFSLSAPNGGPMQLNRFTWEPYFEANFGWTWEQIVTNIDVHLLAARHIYDRAGGWSPWRCY